MKSKNWTVSFLASIILASFVSPLAARRAKVETPEVKADTKANFEVVSAEVRKQLATGGRFEFVTKEERSNLNANLDAMAALFDKYGAVANMDHDAKLALFNDQEAVNTILVRRDSDRVVCTTELPTGSHIPITKCRSFGDIERARSDAQRVMQGLQQVTQPSGQSLPSMGR